MPLLGLSILGLVAAEAASAPWAELADDGILGLLALALIFGQLVPRALYGEMRADRDQARSELISLRQRMDEQVVPALTRSTDAMARLMDKS